MEVHPRHHHHHHRIQPPQPPCPPLDIHRPRLVVEAEVAVVVAADGVVVDREILVPPVDGTLGVEDLVLEGEEEDGEAYRKDTDRSLEICHRLPCIRGRNHFREYNNDPRIRDFVTSVSVVVVLGSPTISHPWQQDRRRVRVDYFLQIWHSLNQVLHHRIHGVNPWEEEEA